jgi:hypothetical protein
MLKFPAILPLVACVISFESGDQKRRLGMKNMAGSEKTSRSAVYCLICTHTVEADVVPIGRRVFVRSGQKCPRCASSLDAAYVVGQQRAA